MYLYISLKKNFFFCTSFKRICTPADDSIVRMFQKNRIKRRTALLSSFSSKISETFLPVKRTPISTLTLWADIGYMTFLNFDFYRRNKFCIAFLALIEVHHL